MLDEITRHCSTCGTQRLFERPHPIEDGCADGHGDDCPERACVECGAAILIASDIDTSVSSTASTAAGDMRTPSRAA